MCARVLCMRACAQRKRKCIEYYGRRGFLLSYPLTACRLLFKWHLLFVEPNVVVHIFGLHSTLVLNRQFSVECRNYGHNSSSIFQYGNLSWQKQHNAKCQRSVLSDRRIKRERKKERMRRRKCGGREFRVGNNGRWVFNYGYHLIEKQFYVGMRWW